MYKVHRHYYLDDEVGPRQGRHRQEPAAELGAGRGEVRRGIEDTFEVLKFEVSTIENEASMAVSKGPVN